MTRILGRQARRAPNVGLDERQAESNCGDHLERADPDTLELIEREVCSKSPGVSLEEFGPEGGVLGRVVNKPHQTYEVGFAQSQDSSTASLSKKAAATCPELHVPCPISSIWRMRLAANFKHRVARWGARDSGSPTEIRKRSQERRVGREWRS